MISFPGERNTSYIDREHAARLAAAQSAREVGAQLLLSGTNTTRWHSPTDTIVEINESRRRERQVFDWGALDPERGTLPGEPGDLRPAAIRSAHPAVRRR